ncbi:flippase [Buchnera aphidicola (Schlechtendalia chinensis)]|uniref:Probable peptidoglycan glycosyltransferase FtsW n=1 Tax=Buchnera aphidicola subsp. Schlechtendalia chinensis TaxID=118110 RepID=A0A172WE81_BUCSC|nr:flippase [Buchnera aphidicola (Schlechtendalia chinensis)]
MLKTNFKKRKTYHMNILYDIQLIWCTISLLLIGLIMVTSSSMSIAQHMYNDLFFFTKKELLYLILALLLAKISLQTSTLFWKRNSGKIILTSIMLLLLVLTISNPINGSLRWIKVGFIHIQPAELSKLAMFCYLSNYLSRKHLKITNSLWEFYKPIGIVFIISILLLLEPDLGTVAIYYITILSLLFITGVKIWKFIPVILISIIITFVLIIMTPYRIERIFSFWNPWNDPFGTGYQLTQSLMALGRGKIFGVGLGHSIQKLEYLPEAHTDFIFSIIGEELGCFGVCIILFIIFFISFRALKIGKNAFKNNEIFSGYFATSIGIWFISQTLINIGTTIGLVPAKGLTLPLISYGGSSSIIMCIAISILIRIDFETKMKNKFYLN